MIDQGVLAHGLLGAHVAERAEQVAAHGQAGIGAEAGQSKVADPQPARPVQQQVARLHVAMDDSQAVGVLQCFRRLPDQRRGGAVELAAAAGPGARSRA